MAFSSSTLSIKNLYKKLSWKFELLSRRLNLVGPSVVGKKLRERRHERRHERRDGGGCLGVSSVQATKQQFAAAAKAAAVLAFKVIIEKSRGGRYYL